MKIYFWLQILMPGNIKDSFLFKVDTGFLRGLEKYGIWFKLFPGLEKYGKSKAEYGKIFVFPDFCLYLVF